MSGGVEIVESFRKVRYSSIVEYSTANRASRSAQEGEREGGVSCRLSAIEYYSMVSLEQSVVQYSSRCCIANRASRSA